MSRIVIAAGGTGGHMFPASSVADRLLSEGHNIRFITDERGVQYLRSEYETSIHNLSTLGWRRWWSIPLASWQIMVLGFSVLLNFLFSRPDCVIGFGGYVTFPVLGLARLFRIPYYIHEQNSVMGIVNRKFAARAAKVMISFPKTSFANDGVLYTGLPVREEIYRVRNIAYSPPQDNLRILVTGGSQGAGIFSEVLPKAMALLPKVYMSKLTLVQQCRLEDIEKVRKHYQSLGVQARLSPFFEHIDQELAQAHLVICRAGASSIAELTITGRPAILVPYPHAMDDHQSGNALYISSHQAGWLMQQTDFIPEKVVALLNDLIADPQTMIRAASAMKSLGRCFAINEIVQQVRDF